jgi:hypothetical protein
VLETLTPDTILKSLSLQSVANAHVQVRFCNAQRRHGSEKAHVSLREYGKCVKGEFGAQYGTINGAVYDEFMDYVVHLASYRKSTPSNAAGISARASAQRLRACANLSGLSLGR